VTVILAALLVCIVAALIRPADGFGDIIVGDFYSSVIHRYDGETCQFIGVFHSPPDGRLRGLRDMVLGPDQHMYVASEFTNGVVRYDVTGRFVDVFVAGSSGGLRTPYRLAFGPDGHLYVTADGNHEVLRYDGKTGTFIGVFVKPKPAGLDLPNSLAFGPDGHLYVVDRGRPVDDPASACRRCRSLRSLDPAQVNGSVGQSSRSRPRP
jgi:hypothetical protein